MPVAEMRRSKIGGVDSGGFIICRVKMYVMFLRIICSPRISRIMVESLRQTTSLPNILSASCESEGSNRVRAPREVTAKPRRGANRAASVRRLHAERFEQFVLDFSGTDTEKGAPAPCALSMFSGGMKGLETLTLIFLDVWNSSRFVTLMAKMYKVEGYEFAMVLRVSVPGVK